jgi:penicillin-binding protein 1A
MQNQSHRKNKNIKPPKKKKRGCLKAFFIFFSLMILFVLIFGGLILVYYLNSLPTLEELTPSPIAETSKVYALDGTLLTEFHATENREIIHFDQMSEHVKKAVIAVEDKRFYDHQGVDYIRIAGAFVADVKAGEFAEGGSTITQQYVKNVFFSHEKTIRRKANEALISIQLERNYTKDKILEMYLNTIYFGSGSYGIEKASQVYFGISSSELSLSQAALLAGLIRAPEIYSPFNDMDKSRNRRNLVLQLMKEQEKITSQEYLDALAEPIVLAERQDFIDSSRVAPYFIDHVKKELYEKKFTDYDVFKGGLRIYTTLDKKLQNDAENAFKKIFDTPIEPTYGLVSLDSYNGYIYALVGGKDYEKSKFNTVTQAQRQPGSVFKVPVLMESIIRNIPPSKTYNPNGPITIELGGGAPAWTINNYGGQGFEGPMSIIDATIRSVNVVYAQLMMEVGAENVENLLEKMEIYEVGKNPAIALGGLEKGVTPLDVSKIFSTLSSGGVYREPVSIIRITDSLGNVLYDYDVNDPGYLRRIMDPSQAYLVTEILERTILEGTGRNANINRPAAGKTGTTSDLRDAWFAGYTPELVTVVWMGHQDSNKAMSPIYDRNVVGGSFPSDIWREFMLEALKDKPIRDFNKPNDEFSEIKTCIDSGKLPTYWCPEDRLEYRFFNFGTEPRDYCDIHNKITVPDLIGLNINEALEILKSMHLEAAQFFEFNPESSPETIFNMEPFPGTIIEAINNIKPVLNIFISKGSETFIMPDIIGFTMEQAELKLNEFGLTINNIVYEFSDLQPQDRIYAQDPVANAEVTSGIPVLVFISKGTSTVTGIPNVIGMTRLDSITTLNNAGFFNIRFVEEQSINEKDRVFAQSPPGGTQQDKSIEVTLIISKGIEVPNVIGQTFENASSALSNLGFKVQVLPEGQNSGNVINQDPAPHSFLNHGSTVKIELSQVSNDTNDDKLEKNQGNPNKID